MTGNDIVDLAVAAVESNWKRKGFLEKQFTQQEQQYIHEAVLPDTMLWRLWTMKESVYKIYNRQHGIRFFAPLKFSCTIFNETTGAVDIDGTIYQTTTSISNDFVYSVARTVDAVADLIADDCFFIAEQDNSIQQQFIYNKIIDHFAACTASERSNILLIKNNAGIPALYYKTDKISTAVSITHHGNYAAFTIN